MDEDKFTHIDNLIRTDRRITIANQCENIAGNRDSTGCLEQSLGKIGSQKADRLHEVTVGDAWVHYNESKWKR